MYTVQCTCVDLIIIIIILLILISRKVALKKEEKKTVQINILSLPYDPRLPHISNNLYCFCNFMTRNIEEKLNMV